MTRTYPTGYKGATIDESALLISTGWLHFDPEYRRRVKAAMDHAYDNGRPVGVGGGYRSSDAQLALFLSRYHPGPAGSAVFWRYELPKPMYSLPAGTLVEWWEKNPDAASAAPPGRSYHEATTPDGCCLAADMVGAIAWINPQLSDFGLVEFGAVNGEPWHWQPYEIPHARTKYLPGLHHPLAVFPLPGDVVPPQPPPNPPAPTPEDDDMIDLDPHARVYDTRTAGLAPFTAGEVREVAVSMGGSAALIRLQAIGTSQQGGYLHVWAGDTEGPTSEANFGPMGSGSDLCRTKLNAGKVKVKASAPCHVIIDTQAVAA